MKNNIFSLFICVLTSLLSSSVMANTCEIPAQLQNLSCVGRFKADSMSDIETYKNTYLQEGVVAKDLVIRFDLDVENLNISSPCKIIFNANRSIKSTGNICLNAKNGLHINKYANIEVKNLALYSGNKIAIRPNATILGDNLTMISTGDSPESRVHIRHSSTVDLKSLTMEASRRATLGHSSQYTVSDSINLKTTGASNVLNQEFVAIWKNTSISTNELNFNSHRQIKLSTGLAITSDTLSLIAPQCKMAKTVTGVAAESCQSLITPKLKVSAKIITADESVEFNASRTTALNEIKSFSYLIDNVFYENVGYRYTHQFKNPGIYSALLVIEDVLGNVVTAKKRIKVLEKQNLGELAAHFYYRQSDDNEVVAYFVPRLGSYEVSSAYYEYSDGSRVDIPHFFHLYETDLAINNDREEITLVINTTDGKVVKKTHVIELGNLSPVVNMDIYHKDEKTFVFDIVNSFDPAMSDDVNGEIDYVEIDFGDGSSEEIDFTDDTFLGFIEHEYSKAGVFTGSLTFVSYETGSSVKEFQVNTESSIDQARMVRFSTVFTDQAEHVRFQFNKSLFVNTELESVLWQYGDGTTSTTTDFEHVHFYDAGVYDVSLTAFFTDKTMQTMTQRIVVQADGPPVVAILDCWEEDTLQAGCWVAVLDKYEDMKSANIDWGDGNTTSINLTDAGYTSNDFTHEYSSEGEYQIKVDIETFRGATGSRSQSLLLEGDNGGGNGGENQIPIAVLNCYSNTPLTVVCDGGASFDPDGDIDSYTFSYQDQSISNGDGSISFVADDSGPLEVSLKVADNEGKFSELVTKVVDVKENLPPVASFICNTDDPRSLSCDGSNSEDVDGQIELFEFYINNERQNNNLSEFTLAGLTAGNYQVKLVVYDEFNEASEPSIQNVTVRDYATPVAGLTCESNSRYSLTCDASSSSISEGYISTYIFNVDGTEYVQNDPYLELNLGYAGLANVSLSVMSNYAMSSQFVYSTIGIIDNSLPEFEISCSNDLLNLSCVINSLADEDGDMVNFVWSVNETQVSTELSINYVAPYIGTYEISLVANDGFGSSVKSVIVDVSSDPSDIIIPKLNCVKVFSKTVNCNTIGTTGNNIQISWLIDNEPIIFTRNDFQFDFAEYGDHTVQAIFKNNYFEKTLKFTENYFLDDSDISFSYSLDTDGDIVLDAIHLFDQGKFLSGWKWTIVETGEEFSTAIGRSTFRYDKINNKQVQLSAVDEEGNIFETTNLIDVSSLNRPPVPKISINQIHGKASPRVSFSSSESFDFDGEVVSTKWTIDGKSYTQENIEILFENVGTKSVELEVTDNSGSTVKLIDKLIIEEPELVNFKDSYNQLESTNFYISNYEFDGVPVIKLGEDVILSNKHKEIGYTFILPYIEPGRDYDLSIQIGDLLVSRKVFLAETVLSEEPDKDLRAYIDNTVGQLGVLFDANIEEEGIFLQEMNLLSTRLKTFISATDDKVGKQMALAFLSHQKLFPDKKITSVKPFKKFLDTIFSNKAYAAIDDSVLVDSAKSCSEGLDISNISYLALFTGASVADAYFSAAAVASIVLTVPSAGTSAPVASFAVAGILGTTISEMILQVFRLAYHSSVIKECLQTVKFPVVNPGDSNFEMPDLELTSDGYNVFRNVKYKFNYSLDGLSFNNYKNLNLDLSRQHPIFRKIDENIKTSSFPIWDFRDPIDKMKNQILIAISGPLGAGIVGTNLLLDSLSTIVTDNMENAVRDLPSRIGEASDDEQIDIKNGLLFNISPNSGKSTKAVQLSQGGILFNLKSKKQDRISLYPVDNKKGLFKVTTYADFPLIKIVYADPCKNQLLTRHVNGDSISFKSKESLVEGTVFMSDGAIVCDKAKILGNVQIRGEHIQGGKVGRAPVIRGDSTFISSHGYAGEEFDLNNKVDIVGDVAINNSNIVLLTNDPLHSGTMALHARSTGSSTIIINNSTLESDDPVNWNSYIENEFGETHVLIEDSQMRNFSILTSYSDINLVINNNSNFMETSISAASLGVSGNIEMSNFDLERIGLGFIRLSESGDTGGFQATNSVIKSSDDVSFVAINFRGPTNKIDSSELVFDKDNSSELRGNFEFNFATSIKNISLPFFDSKLVLDNVQQLEEVVFGRGDIRITNSSEISSLEIGSGSFDNVHNFSGGIYLGSNISNVNDFINNNIINYDISTSSIKESTLNYSGGIGNSKLTISDVSIEDSMITTEMRLSSDVTIKESQVSEQATIQTGAVILNSFITGTANVGSKSGKTCDGVDDNDPEDPCMKSIE